MRAGGDEGVGALAGEVGDVPVVCGPGAVLGEIDGVRYAVDEADLGMESQFRMVSNGFATSSEMEMGKGNIIP